MMSSAFFTLLVATACLATIVAAAPTQEKITRKYLGKEVTHENKVAHIQRRVPQSNQEEESSCNSTKTNDTTPVAYISGYLSAWAEATDDFYNTYWECNENDAFVDGGMRFDNAEKKLSVPECGYYYVSSQVKFHKANPGRGATVSSTPSYAYHQLIVEPNCSENDPTIRARAFATNPDANLWITNTYTGRVFKICAGGKIYVEIPSVRANACCPFGRGSFISAHLVRSTTCSQLSN